MRGREQSRAAAEEEGGLRGRRGGGRRGGGRRAGRRGRGW